mmetsp:Transcript_28580/g.47298  ORF Transcript_28580/g.47298 Transcript_28580/m.47298 type:complete len:396 (+) Transcript_28580:95-1282(+)|eukprot:CAMPEP_0119007726 /NCGR_PEP_ID=MMETSP1176-20130426/3206_1 /TAXON_ID=265551 /ORGANISM="Synedropsis recta cf, Strain CCMP1620" /LENGTH=395 /DNA_ID=CAMNT_0006959927 /DNA_START=57 /DNA_END=1244 /DNA_ORIENTATION=+
MSSETAAAAAATSKGSINYMIYASYMTIIGVWVVSQVTLIPYVLHLLLLVTAILYVACHTSLVLREVPAPLADGSAAPASSNSETLRQEDAYQFPLLGSVSLFSLYLAFKFLDKDLVNLMIGLYFGTVGCLALYATLSSSLPKYGSLLTVKKSIAHPIPSFLVESPIQIDISMAVSEIALFLGSVAFCVAYFYFGKPWAMNNVLGICFCLQGIERFSLGTYKIGAILLVGLFFYDIFWVFGTDVMVTVAKNLDGPIKILFPRGYNDDTGKLELSLLGLGDIVIPGFFLALLLRFDAHRANVATDAPISVHASFPKPYFHSALVAYVAGLGTTLYVMIVFQAAQPALLYLVPACLGSSLLCAAIRMELSDLFSYSEEEEEEAADEAKKEPESKKKD